MDNISAPSGGVSTPATGPQAIDTSLDTIPTGYFGGTGDNGGLTTRRTDAEIQQLAQQRVVVVEKWEGPCWDECLANSSRTSPVACSPACGEEIYQLDTLRRIKAVNPNVSGVFYLNTLYDFPYYNLTAAFTAADLHVRDIRGKLVGMHNDNGMLHIPVFDFSQEAAVHMFLDFHRKLIATGLVDGTFPDKPNERAFQKNGTWWLCENPGGPPPRHSWQAACGEITQDKALAYNAGKAKMLTELVTLYGKKGALWPCARMALSSAAACAAAMLLARSANNLALVAAKHAELVRTLHNTSYIYFMQGDSHGTSLATRCSPDDIIAFLLVLEEGMIIGCNGWGATQGLRAIPRSWWTSKLGKPLGPPVTVGGVVSRSFASGVRVRYDIHNQNGSIDGWEPVPNPAPPPAPPPAPLPAPPCPPLPGYCGAHLIDYGIGKDDIGSIVVTGPGECCDHCKEIETCVAWAWHHEQGNACHVHHKGATKSDSKHFGCVSGFMNRTNPPFKTDDDAGATSRGRPWRG